MQLIRLTILLVLLGSCSQLYSKDTLILAEPGFCGVRWQVLDTLFLVKQETLISNSEITLDQVRLELTKSENEETISVLMTWPEGFSCVIASGGYSIRETRSARERQ